MRKPSLSFRLPAALLLAAVCSAWPASPRAWAGPSGPEMESRTAAALSRPVRLPAWAAPCQDIIDRSVKAGLVGLAVSIRTPADGAWIGTGGYADLEFRTRIHPDAIFYSSSSLKIFTATAVMMLWDEGRIDLDAPIARYLPADMSSRIANASTASVRNLLAHTSGIPDYSLQKTYEGNDPLGITWRDEIESVYDHPADFAPGSRFAYANINFKLLAVIIDQIAGDHAGFLRARVFQPLGMIRTYYREEPELPVPPGLVTPYFDRFGDGSLESSGDYAPALRMNHAYGDDGLLSDVAGYSRFLEALFGGVLLSPQALALMSTPLGPGADYGYGLGMTVQVTVDEARFGRACGHGGRAPFGILDMDHYPKNEVTIVVASNLGYGRITTPAVAAFDRLKKELAEAVFSRLGFSPTASSGEDRIRQEAVPCAR